MRPASNQDLCLLIACISVNFTGDIILIVEHETVCSFYSMASDMYEKKGMIRRYHVYKSIWTPVIGEELPLEAQ